MGSGVRGDKDQDHGGEDQDHGGAGECTGGPFQGGGLRVGGTHEFAGGTSTLFSSNFRLTQQELGCLGFEGSGSTVACAVGYRKNSKSLRDASRWHDRAESWKLL